MLQAYTESAKKSHSRWSETFEILSTDVLWHAVGLRNDLAVICAALQDVTSEEAGYRKIVVEDAFVKALAFFGVGDVFAARSLPPWERSFAEFGDIPSTILPAAVTGEDVDHANLYLAGYALRKAVGVLAQWTKEAGKTIRTCLKNAPGEAKPSAYLAVGI